MEIRQAKSEEIPYLIERLAETEGEQVDLKTARVFVAVDQNRILGILPLRMVWQAEPLLIFSEITNKSTRRRAGLMLYRAACAWLADKTLNRSGIKWFFAVTRSEAVKQWAGRLGLVKQYEGATTLMRYLGDRNG